MKKETRNFLDQDLYKFKINSFIKNTTNLVSDGCRVTYTFVCRNADEIGFYNRVTYADAFNIIQKLREMELGDSVVHYKILDNNEYTKPFYYLEYDLKETDYFKEDKKWSLSVSGPVENVSYFEIFFLSEVSEKFFSSNSSYMDYSEENLDVLRNSFFNSKLRDVLKNKNHVSLIEMGTRRRISFIHQQKVINEFGEYLSATSNVMLSRKFNLSVYGSCPHEGVMLYQALYPRPLDGTPQYEFNKKWLASGQKAFLTDTYDDSMFYKHLLANDEEFLIKFNAFRFDSGDEIVHLEKMFELFKKHKNPKTLIFSNSLTDDKILKIYDRAVKIGYFKSGKFHISFGVGTSLTGNNVERLGSINPNIVMKPSKVEFSDGRVVYPFKLSFDEGKYQSFHQKI